MARTYSLSQLTALPFSPPEMVQLAADTGCAAAGVRLLPASPGGMHYPLMEQPALLLETLARIAGTGVQVLDLEIVRIGEGFDAQALLPFLEVGARLGARHVLVAGDDTNEARLTASFAAFCDIAKPFGLTADLEFMPWTAVPDVRSAVRILTAAGRDNGGILVDALHVARSDSPLAEIAALPHGWLHYAQICDGPMPGPTTVEGLIHAARCDRWLPGEGAIDLAALFAQLPSDLPVSIEIPNDARAPAMGYKAWAAQTLAATRRVLEGTA